MAIVAVSRQCTVQNEHFFSTLINLLFLWGGGDKIKENEQGRVFVTFVTYGQDKKCIRDFSGACILYLKARYSQLSGEVRQMRVAFSKTCFKYMPV
jgi:hypothetical protein